MVRWPVGEAAVVVLWLSRWNSDGPRARSCHEQQIGPAGFVPEHAFAVDPGRMVAKDAVAEGFYPAVGGFDLGAEQLSCIRNRTGRALALSANRTGLVEEGWGPVFMLR
jgi:hypothetical protein